MLGLLSIVSNELGKAHFRAMMCWAITVRDVAGSAGLGLRGLRADLGCLPLGREGELGFGSLRADFGSVLLERGGFCGVELLIGLLKHTIFFAVFLMLQGGDVLYGRDSRGSWNVMCFAVFLKPSGLGGWGG